MGKDEAIQVEDLQKNYGSIRAVKGITFSVREGEIFGIVGPNGAGKTTTVESLEGLRRPDGGTIRVLGLDPQKRRRALHTKIGVQLQESAIAQQIKVKEALDLFAAFYARTLDPEDLMTQLGLTDLRNTRFHHLSGGQKQRLFIALALIHDPELVFLDELTTGLDPQGRHMIWDRIRDINQRGKTFVLTTHYMEEAERLCDRVLIIDHGEVLVLDTPENLIADLSAEHEIKFSVKGEFKTEWFAGMPSVDRVEVFKDRVTVSGLREQLIPDVMMLLVEKKLRYYDLQTQRPNLEDVFLKLTGSRIRN